MPSITQLSSPIVHSPQLTEIARTLQRMPDEERRMQKKLYAGMTPEMKIGSIDGAVGLQPPHRLRMRRGR